MDSIKYTAKGHDVVFSKRTLTIDDAEYSYTGISSIKHVSAYNAYLFKYNNEWVKLFYNEGQDKVISALFKRIHTMNVRRAVRSRATQSIDTSAIKAALEGAAHEADQKADAVAAKVTAEAEASKLEAAKAETAAVPKPEPEVETVEVVEPAGDIEVVVPEAAAVLPAIEVPVAEVPAVEVPAVEVPEAITSEADEVKETAEEPAEAAAETAETEATVEELVSEQSAVKKRKLKKAIIVFAIIIALFVIAGIIYFFTLGPTTDSSQGPSTDGTHQYNDIDELIDEMQE